MKAIRKITKKYYVRHIVAYFLAAYMLLGIPVRIALADPNPGADVLPTGGNVVSGSANINPVVGNSLSITGVANGTVIEWDTFDIGADAATNFAQASTSAWVLNNVQATDALPSGIAGQLSANGNIIISNPLGIVVAPTGMISARTAILSSLRVDEDMFGDFADGTVGDLDLYSEVGDIGSVINNGLIDGDEGVALLAKRVENHGSIISDNGIVIMAAGDSAVLAQPGSDVVVKLEELTSVSSTDDGMGDVINSETGTIEAEEGQIVLAAGDIFSAALDPVVQGGAGRVIQQGEIHADGDTGDGGSVTLTAADGVALISESVTTANAGSNGDGGEIVAYSPSLALFESDALVEAKGGSESGNGGFFELSGREYVQTSGQIDLTASNGYDGEFLLDPLNLTIVAGTGNNNLLEDPTGTWEPIDTPSTLGIDTLEEYLGASNVTLTTIGTVGPEDGDIIFDADRYLRSGVDEFDDFTDNSLFVDAVGDIIFEAGNGIFFVGNGAVELFTPTGSVTSVDRGKIPNIWTRRGDIIIQAGSGGIDMGSIQAGVESLTDEAERPGEIRLTTTDGGDITLQHLNVEGKRYGSVYVDSAGDLTINGATNLGGAVNVSTNTSSVGFVAFSFVCLIADGDVDITSDVTADAHGTLISVAKIWIGAGTHHVDPVN
ncbi:MAG: filamentous hemagglutinin N-terminal domain-containing protein, partial [Planctomycetota bacterium]